MPGVTLDLEGGGIAPCGGPSLLPLLLTKAHFPNSKWFIAGEVVGPTRVWPPQAAKSWKVLIN